MPKSCVLKIHITLPIYYLFCTLFIHLGQIHCLVLHDDISSFINPYGQHTFIEPLFFNVLIQVDLTTLLGVAS